MLNWLADWIDRANYVMALALMGMVVLKFALVAVS